MTENVELLVRLDCRHGKPLSQGSVVHVVTDEGIIPIDRAS